MPGPCWPLASGGLGAHVSYPQATATRTALSVPHTVLRGLIEVRSPHLEELLAALFSAPSAFPASRPTAVVSSLLLQEKQASPAPGEQDSSHRCAGRVAAGPLSGPGWPL